MGDDLIKMFWSRVQKLGPNECWPWLGTKRKHGPVFCSNLKTYFANRFCYRLIFGEIPKGKDVLHTCNNRYCLNPSHLRLGRRPKTVPSLFRRLVNNLKICANGCWEWVGWRDRGGYGKMTIMNGRSWSSQVVSRVVWKLFHGDIPDGMLVCHRCDNPACFRPSHLFLGTSLDNNHDMWSKGRANPPLGERAGNSKITEEQVRLIRSRHSVGGVTQRQLAQEFGIGYKAVCKIIHNQRWKHVV